ncbi:Putative ribonuclease H protein At1g65750 [Linum perenne]
MLLQDYRLRRNLSGRIAGVGGGGGGGSNGKFSIRSAYNLIAGSPLPRSDSNWKKIWRWRRPNKEVGWTPGPTDWTVINTDGSVRQPSGTAAAGGVIRNSSGLCSLAFTANLGICSITRAELRGIILDLNLAWDAGHRKVLVQSDSQVAVNLLTADSEASHHHAHEVVQFRELVARSWEVRLCHIYREGNHVADYLANLGQQRAIGFHMVSPSDCDLSFHLLYDALGISKPRSILSI